IDYVSAFANYSYAHPFIHPQTQQASASKTINVFTGSYYDSGPDIGKVNPNVAPRTYTTSWQRNFDHTSVISEGLTESDLDVWAFSGRQTPRSSTEDFWTTDWNSQWVFVPTEGTATGLDAACQFVELSLRCCCFSFYDLYLVLQ